MVRIFRALVPLLVLALLFGDLLIAIASFLGALWMQNADIPFFLQFEGGALQTTLVLTVLFLSFYFQDFYSLRNLSLSLVLQKILVSIGIVLLFEALASTLDPEWALPRRIMLIGGLLAIVGIFGWHALLQATVGQSTSQQKVVFLGASPAVFELAEHLIANPELGLAPSGYIESAPIDGRATALPWLGPADRCLEIIDAQEPAWVVIGRPEELSPRWVDDFLELRFGGVQIEQVDRLFEESLGRVCSRQLRLTDLAVWEGLFEPSLTVRLQTALSSAVAVVLLVVLAPVMAFLAVLVKLTSGSVLSRTRVAGQYGVPFSLYRFQCTTGEHRIHAIGHILRALKIDGWPQLLNVAAGNMSFIGPSPQRIEFSQRLRSLLPFYPQRHILKPGLTGWAKLNLPAGADALRTLEYDLYYSKHALQGGTFTSDFLILAGLLKRMF